MSERELVSETFLFFNFYFIFLCALFLERLFGVSRHSVFDTDFFVLLFT